MTWDYRRGLVTSNESLDQNIWRMVVYCPEIARDVQPGQFVALRSLRGNSFLPRPMAIFRSFPDHFEIIYKVKGSGTEALAVCAAQDEIYVTGPLGQAVEHDYTAQTIALVGRGVGITPLFSVGQAALAQGATVLSFLSAQTERSLIGQDEFAQLGELYVQVDEHIPGTITSQLENLLRAGRSLDRVYVSGSKRLFKHAQSLSQEFGFELYVFLEERMACGVGHCKGCVIEMAEGPKKYSLCCKDGPLYPAESVVLA